eukprot:m.64026 g.64026  ORF g.64026 m.64026 type:complete len:147 (-) comp19519_c0_seq1:78-518(-)
MVWEAPVKLLALPPELFVCVFKHMSDSTLVACAQVCRDWALVAERIFKLLCNTRKLHLPRRPRGDAQTSIYKYRTLYMTYLCTGCHNAGEWPVMNRGVNVCLLCRECALHSDHVHNIMERKFMTIVTISIHGRKLFREKRKRKPKS